MMNRHNGRAMSRTAHIRQSINDILTTPVGSRVMRRDYGSLLPEIIDGPMNSTTKQMLIAATVDALSKWEPRITIQRVDIHQQGNAWTINLEATTDNGEALNENVWVSQRKGELYG